MAAFTLKKRIGVWTDVLTNACLVGCKWTKIRNGKNKAENSPWSSKNWRKEKNNWRWIKRGSGNQFFFKKMILLSY